MLLALAAHQKVSAQDLQPKKTGLPGRTVWALATSASAPSGTSSVTTFAATDKGLWRSSDNGTSWTETSLKNIGVYAVKSRQIGRTTTLLVGTDRGVLHSTDGGNTWASPEVTTGTAIATSNIVSLKKVFDIEIVLPGNGNGNGNGNAGFWFAATEKGVYRSNNDGRSWSLVNIDRTADNNEVRGITVDGNTVIVNLWKEGLWRSTNSGASWAKLTIGNESTPSKSLFAHTGQIWVQQGKQTTTATVSMLFAGAVSGNLWRSTDNGSSWTKLFSAGTAHRTLSATPTGVDAMTAIGNTLISGTPNGLAVSNDNGATWKSVRTTLPQPLALAVHNQTLFVGLQSAPSKSVAASKGEEATLTDVASPGVGTFPTNTINTCSGLPTVTGFTPASVDEGNNSLVITVHGHNFAAEQIILVNQIDERLGTYMRQYQQFAFGQVRDGAIFTLINSTTIQFSVPAAWLTIASRIGVSLSSYSGGCSGSGGGQTFYVRIPNDPRPFITGISPATIIRNTASPSISITGSGYSSGVTQVFGNLSGQSRIPLTVTSISGTNIVATLPASLVAAAGTVTITAENTGVTQNATSTITIANPAPTLTNISPASAVRGDGSVAATITGTNFVPESQVVLNSASGRIVAPRTTYVSATQLQTYWEAAWLLPTITADSYAVTVENPTPGGGVSTPQTLSVLNPTPIAAGLIPAQVIANAPGQSLTITGNGFMVGSQVYLNGQLKSATFNNGSLSITLAASDIPTAGDYSVMVVNPAPGGGSSGALTLQALNPTPTITAFSPSPLALGQDATLTLSGGGSFVSGAVARLYPSDSALTTVFVNANTLTVTVPGSFLSTVSETQYSIRVRNPAPGGGLSAPVTVPVRNAAPSFSGVSPATLVAAAQDTSLTLSGGNFLSGATVLISGPGVGLNTPLTTTVVNTNTITATLPAGIAGSVGQYSLIVRNPNAVADSPAQTINVIYPQAELSSVTPSPAPAQNAAQALTLSGARFVGGALVRIQDEATGGQTVNQLLAASVVSATQINATLPQTLAERVGRYRLTVNNPTPNAGVSGIVLLDVLALAPSLSSITPASAAMTGAAQTLLLTGTNFVSSAQNGTIVELNGQAIALPVTASVQSANTISVILPVSMLDSAREFTLRVVNPSLTINGVGQGGGASTTHTFTLLHPEPTLSTFAPQLSVANPTNPSPTLFVLTGSHFTASSRVLLQRIGSGSVDTLHATPNNLTGGLATVLALTLPANTFIGATTFTLRVFTPYGSVPSGFVSGGTSAPQTLTVQNPQPAITTLAPAQSLILQTTTVTITGTNFVPPSAVNNQRGTLAYLGSTLLPTSVLSPTTLQITIDAALLAAAQDYALTVQNPPVAGLGGGVSNPLTFTALNPTALLNSIVVPSGVLPLVVSSATQMVNVFGQFFVEGATVTLSRMGGAAVTPQTLSTTFVSPTHVTLSIPTAFLAESGTLWFQVANPNPTGGASNLLSVTIVNPRPRLFTLTPTTATISASDLALTLDGGNFLPNSTVFVRGTTLGGADTTITLAPTGYTPAHATPTTLTVNIPTDFAALAGTYFVWVQNPTPIVSTGGVSNGNSDTLFFALDNPLPTLLSVTPDMIPTGSDSTLITLSGTNFTPLAELRLNGVSLPRSRFQTLNRTTILYTFTKAELATAATYSLQVTMPAPGGGASDTLFVAVQNPEPALVSLLPTNIDGLRDTVITATGTGFTLASQFRLRWDTSSEFVPIPTFTLLSATEVRLNIPAALITTLGTYHVSLFNPAPGGGTSSEIDLTVQAGAPVSMEFLNVTTAIVAGGEITGVQIRLRDAAGFLSDIPTAAADSLYAVRLPDSTLNAALRFGLPLQRVSEGLYDVSTTPLTTVGTYRLALDSVPMAGINTIIGNRILSVQANVRAQVWIEFLNNNSDSAITSISAGQNLHHLRLTYRDAFHNRTDSAVGTVELLTLPDNIWGTSTATLTMQRTGTGVYALAAPLRLVTAGTYIVRPEGVSREVVLATTADSLLVVPDTAVTAVFAGVLPQLNAGESQAAFTVQFRDRYGNATHTALDSVRYTNATSASVANAGVVALTPTGTGAFTASALVFTVSGNYTLTTIPGVSAVGTSAFAVQALAAETVELSDAPDTLWTAQPLPPVIVRFRDLYGNLTNDSRALDFADDGAPSSTGTVALAQLGTGVYTTSGTVFWQSGNYAFSVNGISPSNMLGTQAFFVKPDTAFPLILTAILPQSLTVGDSAVHGWTLTITGDNFNASSIAYHSFSNIALPTTFINETELHVHVPSSMQQFGSYMLRVKNTAPLSASNVLPFTIIDADFRYIDSLAIISSVAPFVLAEEQAILNQLQQNPNVVSINPIRVAPAMRLLATERLMVNVATNVSATLVISSKKQVGEGDFILKGYVENDSLGSEVMLTITDRKYIGSSIPINGTTYQIQPVGNQGLHAVSTLTSEIISQPCALSDTETTTILTSPPPPITDCNNRIIQILFVVTPDAMPEISNIKGLLAQQMDRANLALQRSLEWTDKPIVRLQALNNGTPLPWDYKKEPSKQNSTEADIIKGIVPDPLPLSVFNGAKILRESSQLLALRDKYQADVIAIVHLADYGSQNSGVATQIFGYNTEQIQGSANNAFILLKNGALNENVLLAHEMGHILGNFHVIGGTPEWRGHGYIATWKKSTIDPFSNTDDIMATDGNSQSLTFSSPILKFPGVYYASDIIKNSNCMVCYTNRFHPLTQGSDQYNNGGVTNNPIFLKKLATHSPEVPDITKDAYNILNAPLVPIVPFGTEYHDATQTIHDNAPFVASYRVSGLKIEFLDPLPAKMNRGESATVRIKLSGCQSNSHRVIFYANTSSGQLFFRDITFGTEITLTETITMPTGSGYYGTLPMISIGVILETASGNPGYWNEPGYASTGTWNTVFCGDCVPGASMLAFKNTASIQSRIGNTKRNNGTNKADETPTSLDLLQNSPNPFSEQTEIRFALPKPAQTTLKIYNALGVEVTTLVDTGLAAGYHTVTFPAQSLPSGIYTYRLQSNGQVMTRKMVIVR